MAGPSSILNDVSDTALWVAVFRARESERPDALFRDPLARRLAGAKGPAIARRISGSHYTAWSVVIRTHVIDRLLVQRVAEGVDMVINLGAGLDTRPYRMDLPPALRWIEVDYPHMVRLKEQELSGETPRIRLERVGLDLADREARKALFARLGSESGKVLILTEGVLPYLTPEQVSSLADDLRAQANFRYWIAEYFSPRIYRFLRTRKRQRQMRNAPFQFFPDDWFGFFGEHGWKERETRYLPEVSQELGRPIPMPWWAQVLRLIFRPKDTGEFRKFSGYTVLEPLPKT